MGAQVWPSKAIARIKERKIMGTLNILKHGLNTLIDKSADSENTIPKGVAEDQEATLATVIMTRLHDPRIQNKFHRLLLISEDNSVLSTYPLNRKIMYIGRSRRNHVQINDPQVSVRHMTVSVSADTCVVNDLDSSNGTFINGERLSGGRVLNDGDEILLGKTLLRFAARQESTLVLPNQAHRKPRSKKKYYLPAAAVLCMAVMAAIVFKGPQRASSLFTAKVFSSAEQKQNSSRPVSEESVSTSQLPVQAGGISDLHIKPRAAKTSYIQQALADYSAGRLDSATQILNNLSAAMEQSPEAFQARQIMALLDTVRELHAEALKAQKQKAFAKAIEYWDRLLVVDMELIGNRPSFFASEAERTVQTLSYDYALEAYRSKNHKKAKQLCRVILEINPDNKEAIELLAKIDSKA